MNTSPIAPHPKLDRFYAHEADRRGVVNDLFDAGASSYEWICKVMSLGTGERYRGQALRDAGLVEGARILDIATGTGMVLRSASTITAASGRAIGLDPSPGMLRECRKACASSVIQGLGEHLPFADATFDMVSMGYGLRHVDDLRGLFGEYFRVLAPGGRVLILEMTQPQSAWGRRLNRFYLGTLVPNVAYLTTGRAAARRMMDYFWDTVDHCVPPSVILAALRDSGFVDPVRRVQGGILSEYVAVKPR